MKVQEYMLMSGMPAKFITADLKKTEFFDSEFLHKDEIKRYKYLYSMAKSVVDDFKMGACIEGISGSGKSFLASAMVREYLRTGRKSARTSADEIKTYYFDDFQGFRERHTEAEVLLIEDIDSDVVGVQQSAQIISELIKLREDRGLLTLVTAKSDKGIKSKFNDGIYRLIKGSMLTFEMPKVDLRQLEVKKYAKELIEGRNEKGN